MTSKHRSTCVVVDVIIYAVGQIILMEYCYRYSIFKKKKVRVLSDDTCCFLTAQKLDTESVVESAPGCFQSLLTAFGVEATIESLIQSVCFWTNQATQILQAHVYFLYNFIKYKHHCITH